MTDRDLIKKLNQENKKFRLKTKELEGERLEVTGKALFLSFMAAAETQGVYLERAVLSCDMTMGIACAQVSASEILHDFKIKEDARALFRHAAKIQKSLMPFAEAHFHFIEEDESLFNPEKLKAYLSKMAEASPILAQAETLNNYCIEWRDNFVEQTNALLETQ